MTLTPRQETIKSLVSYSRLYIQIPNFDSTEMFVSPVDACYKNMAINCSIFIVAL